MRSSFRYPASAWLVAATLGFGLAQPSLAKRETTFAPGHHPIALLAPRPETALIGGTTAELRWSELPIFTKLGKIEEWEAFLSLDGGKTYSIRITPHLDHDVRVLRWEVPAVATSDARLLFRFGKEGQKGEEEAAYYPPERFRIELQAVDATPLHIVERAHGLGEAAEPGQPGVVRWAAGSRRGTDLRQVEAGRPLELSPRPGLDAGPSGEPLAIASQDRRTETGADLSASTSLGSWNHQRERLPLAPPAAAQIPPLLQSQRQNE